MKSTGAVWPPYEGAGQGYWARQAGFSLSFEQQPFQQETYQEQPYQAVQAVESLPQQQFYAPQMVSGQTYFVPRQQQQLIFAQQHQHQIYAEQQPEQINAEVEQQQLLQELTLEQLLAVKLAYGILAYPPSPNFQKCSFLPETQIPIYAMKKRSAINSNGSDW